jgi:glycosyltransferase involved in cell wall biosynthesis
MIALTDAASELALVLEEDAVGWTVSPHEPAQLAAAILQAYSKRRELGEMARRARRAALEKYSLKTAVAAYRRVLSS